MGKNYSSVLILISRQCCNILNNIVSTFLKFGLLYFMLEVSSSYSHRHKNRYKKQKCNQNRIAFDSKRTQVSHLLQPRYLAKLFKHWNQLLVTSEDFKTSTDCFAKCLNVLAACFNPDTQMSLTFIRTCREFLKTWSVKSINSRLHTSNENLELLAELHIHIYFEIFQAAYFFSIFLHFCFFRILIIKSEFRDFTQVTNLTNWNETALVLQGQIQVLQVKCRLKTIKLYIYFFYITTSNCINTYINIK